MGIVYSSFYGIRLAKYSLIISYWTRKQLEQREYSFKMAIANCLMSWISIQFNAVCTCMILQCLHKISLEEGIIPYMGWIDEIAEWLE